MKSRMILVLVALCALWGNSYVLMQKMGEIRGQDLLAFRLLRLQDQAFLISRQDDLRQLGSDGKENFWVLRMALSENGAAPEFKLLKGQQPSDLDSSQLATLVAESNVERGSVLVPTSASGAEYAVGFSKRGASYFLVGQSGQEWIVKARPWDDYFKWNLLGTALLLLLMVGIRFWGLRRSKEVPA